MVARGIALLKTPPSCDRYYTVLIVFFPKAVSETLIVALKYQA